MRQLRGQKREQILELSRALCYFASKFCESLANDYCSSSSSSSSSGVAHFCTELQEQSWRAGESGKEAETRMDRPPFQPPTSKLQAGIKVVFLLERLLFFQFIYYINISDDLSFFLHDFEKYCLFLDTWFRNFDSEYFLLAQLISWYRSILTRFSFSFFLFYSKSSFKQVLGESFYTRSSTFCTKKWNEAEEGGTYSRFPGERVRNLQIFAKMERRRRRRRDGRRLLRVQSYNFDKLPSVETNEEKRAREKDFVL